MGTGTQGATVTASALDGLRVVDMSTYLPGPYATMLLADLGADVLHVEPPGGDPGRRMPERVGDDSALHWWVSRNKRSLVLDLKRPADRERLLAEVADADVVVETFRPGVARRLGVDYEACRKVNERVIYCAITGYGQEGELANVPGHDVNYSARSGILGLSTDDHGEPVVVGLPITDVAGGLHAAVAILAAVHYQRRTNKGQYIDISIVDASLGLVGLQLMKALAGHPPRKSTDMNLGAADPAYGMYRTRDGKHITIGCLEEKFWRRLCQLLEREDLIQRRVDEPEAVRRELAAIFAREDRAHWDRLLADQDVCYAPVLDIDELVEDARVRGAVVTIPDERGVERPTLANPIRMSLTPPRLRSPAPPLTPGRDLTLVG